MRKAVSNLAYLGDQIDWSSPQAQGLIAAWPLNDGGGTVARDLRGTYHGTITSPLQTTMNIGKSLAFDGTNRYVNCGDIPYADGLGQIAISFLFRPSATGSSTTNKIILSKWDGTNGYQFLFAYGNDTLSKIAFYVRTGGTGIGGNSKTSGSSPALVSGITYHCAGVYDGATVNLYINGILVSSAAGSGTINTNASSNLVLGKYSVSTSQYLFGALADVRIYNRALSASEVQDIYVNPAAIYARRPSITNFVPAISVGGYTLSADTGSYTLTGNAAGLRIDRLVSLGSGSFALSGTATGLTAARKLGLASVSFALTGNAAGLTYSPTPTGYTLAAATGSFALTGQSAGLLAGRQLATETGTFALSGKAVTLTYSGAGGGGLGLTAEEVRAIVVDAITDPATLAAIAAAIWGDVASYSLGTKGETLDSLESSLKGVGDYDLTDIYNNTPSIDPSSVWSYVTRTLTAGTRDSAIDAIKVKTDNLPADTATTLSEMSADVIITKAATEAIQDKTDLLPSDIPNAVWDEALSGHTTAGTAGKALSDAATTAVGGTVINGLTNEQDANLRQIRQWVDWIRGRLSNR